MRQNTSRYDFADSSAPSFVEVRHRALTEPIIPANRRAQLVSSLTTLVRLGAIEGDRTPFTPRHVRVHLAKLTPGGTGLSKKRLQNLRSDVNCIVRLLGLGGTQRYLTRLSSEWAALASILGSRYEVASLKRLMQFASAQNLDPTGVDDDFATQFLRAMEADEILKDPRTAHKNAVRAWNRAVDKYSAWPRRKLTVPVYRLFWGLPWSAFEHQLVQAIDDFLRSGQEPNGENIFDELAPTQPLRPTTIRTQRDHFRLAATVLSASCPTSLADICNPYAFKTVISQFIERHGKGVTPYIAQIAWTLTKAARHGGVLETKDIEEVNRLFRKVVIRKVADNRHRIDRDQIVLDQLDDPAVMDTLLSLPRRIADNVLKSGRRGWREALLVQKALALELWLCAPLRISNFVALNLNDHFAKVREGKNDRLIIRVTAENVKNGEPLEHYLHDDAAGLLNLYVAEFLPLLKRGEEWWLFPGRNGRHKNASPFRQQMEKFLKEHVALEIHPHLLRPATIATRFNLLNEALRVMAPRLNRTLLVLGLRRLQSKGRRETMKRIPPVSASDLYIAGIARMNRVQTQTYEKRDVQAVQFGDGLMMAMLAAKPIRIGSLARTNVGEHLLRKVDRYHWTFSAAETKNAEPVHVVLPEGLTTYVDQWLEIYRPVLLGPTMSRAMWISRCRERMAISTIYARFCAATLEELGHRINPHMVRSIVATSVSVSMTNEVRIIPSLLDHRSSTVARRHYIVADSLAASEQYLARLNARRQAAFGSASKKQRKPR